MMDESKEREAFEKWYSEEGKWPAAIHRSCGTYTLAQTQTAWNTWFARAALAQPEPEPEQWKVVDEWAGGCRLRRVQPEPEPEPDADVLETSPPLVIRVRRHPEPEPELPDAELIRIAVDNGFGIAIHNGFGTPTERGVIWFDENPLPLMRAAIFADRKRRNQP